MSVQMNIKSNKDKVLVEFDTFCDDVLDALGQTAERYAKEGEIKVDTGRLRNSITYAKKNHTGQKTYSDNKGNSYSDGEAIETPEEKTVYIGTNVEYGQFIEIGTVKMAGVHFLRNAVADHTDEYKTLIREMGGKA